MTPLIFNQYVEETLRASPELIPLRAVVEKELLHYEIFSALESQNFLDTLVFQGGTCLRLCYGAERFSEDLDFAGGLNFSSTHMKNVAQCIQEHIGKKFSLEVRVKEPSKKEESHSVVKVDKWTVSVTTNVGRPDLPAQKIKIEIANIPAYTLQIQPIRANYSVIHGKELPMLNCESLDEILADKLLALPLSMVDPQTPVRYRDMWDIPWLISRNASLNVELVWKKVADYGVANFEFALTQARSRLLEEAQSKRFQDQMSRFINPTIYSSTLANTHFASYIHNTIDPLFQQLQTRYDYESFTP